MGRNQKGIPLKETKRNGFSQGHALFPNRTRKFSPTHSTGPSRNHRRTGTATQGSRCQHQSAGAPDSATGTRAPRFLFSRAVGNDHFCDTTKMASQRLTPHIKGEIPLYHRSGEKPLDPTTLLFSLQLLYFKPNPSAGC